MQAFETTCLWNNDKQYVDDTLEHKTVKCVSVFPDFVLFILYYKFFVCGFGWGFFVVWLHFWGEVFWLGFFGVGWSKLLFPPILFLEIKYSFWSAVLREQNRKSIPKIQVGIPGLEKLRKQKEKNKDKKLAANKSVQKLAVSFDYIQKNGSKWSI